MQDNPRRSILAMVMALRRGHTQLTVSMCWMQKANPNLRPTFTMFYVKSNSHPLNLMKWTYAQNFQKNGHADIMGLFFFIKKYTDSIFQGSLFKGSMGDIIYHTRYVTSKCFNVLFQKFFPLVHQNFSLALFSLTLHLLKPFLAR